jgi:hypothetical protein
MQIVFLNSVEDVDTESENSAGEEGDDGHSVGEEAQSDPEYEPDDEEDEEDSSGEDGDDSQDPDFTLQAPTDLKKTSKTRSDNRKDLSARPGVSCSICQKQFKGHWAKKNLKRHLDLHAAEPNYPCTHCPARFKQYMVCRSHIREVHLKIVPVKKLACGFCPKKFAYPIKKKLHEMVRNTDFQSFILLYIIITLRKL